MERNGLYSESCFTDANHPYFARLSPREEHPLRKGENRVIKVKERWSKHLTEGTGRDKGKRTHKKTKIIKREEGDLH